MGKLLLSLLVIGAGVGVWWFTKCCNPTERPQLQLDEWWGPKDLRSRQDTSIKPFKVVFSEEMIADLKARIKNHRPWTPPLEGVSAEYGFNSGWLSEWLQYWEQKYPFAAREKYLNSLPQFKTNVQGLDIHFIRVKPQVSSGVEVVPILLLHGWPGSVREFYEAVPLLTKQIAGYNFVFEVIVPSLPGYGFSDAAVRPGLGAAHVGVVMRNLMHRLGHKKYYVQGGDWGAVVGSAMATLFPDEVLGWHTNMAYVQNTCAMVKTVFGSVVPSLYVESHLADRLYPLTDFFYYVLEEFGYFHLQATKPDTIGVGLSDSPSGLLAYIVEKFATWTIRERTDAGLKRFTKEQLIDNLMVYWTSQTITSSMRLYYETMRERLDLDSHKTPVPTWALQAKHELFYQPPAMLKTKFTNLVNTTTLDEGGHFIAFEMPQVFAADVFKAVKAFKEFHQKKVKTEL